MGRLRAIADEPEFPFVTPRFDDDSPVLERTAPRASELPVILVGDFRMRTDDQAWPILTGGEAGAGPRFDDAFVLAGRVAQRQRRRSRAYDPSQRIDPAFVAGAD
ncbi:hypothetical protein SAMN02745121_05413 [Nannocystis exedens]|uniref:Uncharacterized protein n=1 Tax=Nannocystis exedens TaxID=54 RepID=A0A1I2D6K3_9BACT|nr:hypothetical protein [Nannocystis exedens]PCC70702.1 hypothetical protein NAEX_03766 [Nannocystis exedens]SFE76101.1 hypothetical protein SAMN02745121_05413 [Nannocystis exedens]